MPIPNGTRKVFITEQLIGVYREKTLNMDNRIKRFLSLSIGSFVRILFPSYCLSCGSFTEDSDTLLCPSCRSDLPVLKGRGCRCCGEPFVAQLSPAHLCGRCLSSPPAFSSVKSYAAYDEPFVSLLKRLKYNNDTAVLPLIRELEGEFSTLFPPETELICPVPLHKQRLRSRGYNQSLLLARAMFPDNMAIIVPDVLKRVENSVSQTGLRRKERAKNLRNAFVVRNPECVRGKTVCLIDDIYTTGATLDACAKVLMKSGACKVHGVTVARAVLLAKRL